MTNFSLFVNGKQYPNAGLSMDLSHEITSVLAYNPLFERSGIHHSNAGLQIPHDIFINVYFILFFDLTPDRAASGRIQMTVFFGSNVCSPIHYRNQSPALSTWNTITLYLGIFHEPSEQSFNNGHDANTIHYTQRTNLSRGFPI
jgi:hypothetical protein